MAGVVNVSITCKPNGYAFKHSLLGRLPDFVTPSPVIFKNFTADEVTVFLFAFVHFDPCNVVRGAWLFV
jgi:hypothetical protein